MSAVHSSTLPKPILFIINQDGEEFITTTNNSIGQQVEKAEQLLDALIGKNGTVEWSTLIGDSSYLLLESDTIMHVEAPIDPELEFALRLAQQREDEGFDFIRQQYGSIEEAQRKTLWDDDARKALRTYRIAVRERSEYESLLARKRREAAIATQGCD